MSIASLESKEGAATAGFAPSIGAGALSPTSASAADDAALKAALVPELPASRKAMAALLRARLSHVAGGVKGPGATITAPEFLTYLSSLVPRDGGVSAAAVGAVARRLRKQSENPALAPEIPVEAIVKWLAGEEAAAEGGDSGSGAAASARAAAPSSASPDVRAAINGAKAARPRQPRVFPSAADPAAERFTAFRVAWEARHGHAARKEATIDAAERAGPRPPFTCLHLASAPPRGAA